MTVKKFSASDAMAILVIRLAEQRLHCDKPPAGANEAQRFLLTPPRAAI